MTSSEAQLSKRRHIRESADRWAIAERKTVLQDARKCSARVLEMSRHCRDSVVTVSCKLWWLLCGVLVGVGFVNGWCRDGVVMVS